MIVNHIFCISFPFGVRIYENNAALIFENTSPANVSYILLIFRADEIY